MKKLVATAPRVAALVEYEDRAILANEVKIRVRFGAPVEIKGPGKEEHAAIVDFIKNSFDEWVATDGKA